MNLLEIIILVLLIIFLFFLGFPLIIILVFLFSRYDSKSLNYFEESRFNNISKDTKEEIKENANYLINRFNKVISIKSFDNVCLKADYIDNNSDTTVILIHGYHTTPLNCFHTLGKVFCEQKYNVMFVHSRGHNKSSGKRFYLGIKEVNDILCIIDNCAAKKIILVGASNGCYSLSLASKYIKDERVKCLLLDCGFTNPFAYFVKNAYTYYMPKSALFVSLLFVKLFYKMNMNTSSLNSLKENNIPSFFTHGLRDDVVDVSETKKAFEANKSDKELIIVNDACHVMAYNDKDTTNKMLSFIKKYL